MNTRITRLTLMIWPKEISAEEIPIEWVLSIKSMRITRTRAVTTVVEQVRLRISHSTFFQDPGTSMDQ